MDHAPAHRNQERADLTHAPCLLQGVDAARRQRQIDRAAAFCVGGARVWTTVVEVDLESATGKEHREEGAREAGSDDVDPFLQETCGGAHWVSRRTSARCSLKRNTSSKVLYSGTGATRMTLGSRQSHTTPCSPSRPKTLRPRVEEPPIRMEIWQPRASTSRGVINSAAGFRRSIRNSRKPVSSTDFARSLSMSASWKISSEARSGAAARIDGLLICQAAMPGAGRKCGSIRMRVGSSWPHH